MLPMDTSWGSKYKCNGSGWEWGQQCWQSLMKRVASSSLISERREIGEDWECLVRYQVATREVERGQGGTIGQENADSDVTWRQSWELTRLSNCLYKQTNKQTNIFSRTPSIPPLSTQINEWGWMSESHSTNLLFAMVNTRMTQGDHFILLPRPLSTLVLSLPSHLTL